MKPRQLCMPRQRARGFTLIEVLVAIVIIAIGLLGLAGIQALAVSSTGIARMRGIAAIEVSSLASMMHADKAFWGAGLAPPTITVTGTTASPLPSTYANCTTTPCTAAQMATYDLSGWAQNLPNRLPNPGATIQCTNIVGTPVTCRVTITWSEKYVGASSTAAVASGAQTATLSYSELVQP